MRKSLKFQLKIKFTLINLMKKLWRNPMKWSGKISSSMKKSSILMSLRSELIRIKTPKY